jgi:hypothetical protein
MANQNQIFQDNSESFQHFCNVCWIAQILLKDAFWNVAFGFFFLNWKILKCSKENLEFFLKKVKSPAG